MNWKYLTVGTILLTFASIIPLRPSTAVATSTSKLKIDKVICIDMQDSGSNGRADEPYLEINGNIIWSQKVTRGDIKNLLLEVPFNSSME